MLPSSVTKAAKAFTWKNPSGSYWGYENKYEKIADVIQGMVDDTSAPKVTAKTTVAEDDITAEIKEITLLDKNEFERYKDLIRPLNRRWWLKDPGENSWFIQVAYADKDRKCVRDALGDHVTALRYVRPALIVDLPMTDARAFHKADKLIGKRIKFKGYMWTILDVNAGSWYIFCDTTIGEHCYDSIDAAWETCELKRWLETEGLELITG